MACNMLYATDEEGKGLKVALTVWRNRISPVFDAAQMMLIADIENNTVMARRYESLGAEMPFPRASRLSQSGVNTLICGAISREYTNAIEFQGIRVIPFVTGDVNQVLDAYLKGYINRPCFQMPGCGRKGRRRFRGRRG